MRQCIFDKSNNIDSDVVRRGDKDIITGNVSWYAFVPDNPEIFGHIIVTVEQPCIREIISESEEVINEALKRMSEGIKVMSDLIKKIDNVQRIYVAMLGETDSVHMHYHIIPRYGFIDEIEINKWAEKNRFDRGIIEWQRFYSHPTLGFQSLDGFQYLGEIERSYNQAKRVIGEKPSSELIKEIVNRIKNL